MLSLHVSVWANLGGVLLVFVSVASSSTESSFIRTITKSLFAIRLPIDCNVSDGCIFIH